MAVWHPIEVCSEYTFPVSRYERYCGKWSMCLTLEKRPAFVHFSHMTCIPEFSMPRAGDAVLLQNSSCPPDFL